MRLLIAWAIPGVDSRAYKAEHKKAFFVKKRAFFYVLLQQFVKRPVTGFWYKLQMQAVYRKYCITCFRRKCCNNQWEILKNIKKPT